MPAFSPINENVFTAEAGMLLGPPVHKPYGWLPLITGLLETCAWSGLTVARPAPERAPVCFAWIVGNQQGFILPGNSIAGLSSCWWGMPMCAVKWNAFFMQPENGKRSMSEKVVSRRSLSLSPWAQSLGARPPWQGPAHISERCHLNGLRGYDPLYFVFFIKITVAASRVHCRHLYLTWKSWVEVGQWSELTSLDFPYHASPSQPAKGSGSCLGPCHVLAATHPLPTLPPMWTLALHVLPSEILHQRPHIYINIQNKQIP